MSTKSKGKTLCQVFAEEKLDQMKYKPQYYPSLGIIEFPPGRWRFLEEWETIEKGDLVFKNGVWVSIAKKKSGLVQDKYTYIRPI